MKAAVVKAWGEPPEYTDFAEPAPTDGTEVATVEASALTNLTRGLVSGNHHASKEIQLPVVAGVDGVARLTDGRRVYTDAVAPYGTMAERALINPDAATPLPDSVDAVTAAVIPTPGLSAWMSLDYAAAIKPGTHVLVLGATGVTGPTMNVPAGALRSAGITLSGMGMGSVPFEVLIRARNEGLPRLLAMVAAGELHIETKQRPLADVADAWASPEPSGTRVVLTP